MTPRQRLNTSTRASASSFGKFAKSHRKLWPDASGSASSAEAKAVVPLLCSPPTNMSNRSGSRGRNRVTGAARCGCSWTVARCWCDANMPPAASSAAAASEQRRGRQRVEGCTHDDVMPPCIDATSAVLDGQPCGCAARFLLPARKAKNCSLASVLQAARDVRRHAPPFAPRHPGFPRLYTE